MHFEKIEKSRILRQLKLGRASQITQKCSREIVDLVSCNIFLHEVSELNDSHDFIFGRHDCTYKLYQ